jgi:hypothetical protein
MTPIQDKFAFKAIESSVTLNHFLRPSKESSMLRTLLFLLFTAFLGCAFGMLILGNAYWFTTGGCSGHGGVAEVCDQSKAKIQLGFGIATMVIATIAMIICMIREFKK